MANTANQVLTLQKLAEISKDILETCPIAHYLRVSTIPVSFSVNDETSYFDHYNFQIVIAFNNIVKSIGNKASNNNNQISDVDLERTIRSLLYHEISHAILTPKDAKRVAQDYHDNDGYIVDADLENIIEDERIETILKHYYLNVDFKENLRSIVKLEQATNFKHFVFNAVRFRYCPIRQQEVNEQVKLFIENTKSYNATNGSAYSLIYAMEALCKYLDQVWQEWLALCNANTNQVAQNGTKQGQTTKEQPQSEQDTKGEEQNAEDDSQSESGSSNQETESTEGENGEQESTEGEDENTSDNASEENAENEEDCEREDDSQSSSKDAEKGCSENDSQSETKEPQEPTQDQCADDELTEDEIEQMARMMAEAITQLKRQAQWCGGFKMKLSDYQYENETYANLLKVIVKNQGLGNKQSPIRYGYCGTLNAKRFMKDHNETYKWFERKSFADDNNGNKQAKKILNIFLDNSGSFSGNDYEVNKILSALQDIERKVKNFEFRLIRWGTRAVRNYGEERISNSHDAWTTNNTRLDETFMREFKEATKTKQEYNIFLTDGSIGGSTIDNVRIFNNNRSVIITQGCNTWFMKSVCPNCRAIIEENQRYAEQLKINIAKALDALF